MHIAPLTWLRLIRVGNVLLSGAAAVVGAYLASGRIDLSAWLLLPLAPMLITAAGNIQNDIFDRDIDRQNRPDRPLATDAVSLSIARWVTAIFYIVGLGTAIPLGWVPLIIAGLVIVLLNSYNASWSRLPVIGNIAVSLMGALPVIYGATGLSSSVHSRLAIPFAAALVAFWLHLARELLKDVADIEGDRASGRRTLPIICGPVAAMRWSALIMLIAAASAFWLATTGWLTVIYMFGICVTVLPALVFGAAQSWWRTELPIASFWAGGLKLIMLAGLVWMVLAVRTP